MAEGKPRGVWPFRAAFLGVAILSLFLRLLPLSTLPSSWPGPDLLVGLAFAWVLRTPIMCPPC